MGLLNSTLRPKKDSDSKLKLVSERLRDQSPMIRRMREAELSLALPVIQRSPSPDRFAGFWSSPGSLHSSPLGPTLLVMETETETEGSEGEDTTSFVTMSSYQSLGSRDSLNSLSSLPASEPDHRGYEADISSNEDEVLCDF